MQNIISKAGLGGPFFGGLLGAFPQCGFSTAASNLYAGRIITIGTLMSVYLSTSDEMLPIMISEKAGISRIISILIIKVICGMVIGFVLDFVYRKSKQTIQIEHLCEHHHCHCEKGIFQSALKHTLEIFAYILGISFALNLIISFIGENALASIIMNKPFLGEILAGIVGLIPNCAGSVIVTKLFLENVISFGAAMSGLLAGSGVGILVLFKVNDNIKENIKILGMLYSVSVILGSVIGLFIK